jgi:Hemin uptake protein hemP
MSAHTSQPPPTAPHGQTNLDRRMEVLLGDSLPKHFGSGWFSGVFGVLLGTGSFLTVLVFRYPQWLTDLLKGQREAVIEHDDQDYRLRITASGKLILTK